MLLATQNPFDFGAYRSPRTSSTGSSCRIGLGYPARKTGCVLRPAEHAAYQGSAPSSRRATCRLQEQVDRVRRANAARLSSWRSPATRQHRTCSSASRRAAAGAARQPRLAVLHGRDYTHPGTSSTASLTGVRPPHRARAYTPVPLGRDAGRAITPAAGASCFRSWGRSRPIDPTARTRACDDPLGLVGPAPDDVQQFVIGQAFDALHSATRVVMPILAPTYRWNACACSVTSARGKCHRAWPPGLRRKPSSLNDRTTTDADAFEHHRTCFRRKTAGVEQAAPLANI